MLRVSWVGGDIPFPAIGRDVYDRGSGSSSPSEQTVHLLAAAGRAADALMTERLSAGGLSALHQSVLRTLAEGGRTPGAISPLTWTRRRQTSRG